MNGDVWIDPPIAAGFGGKTWLDVAYKRLTANASDLGLLTRPASWDNDQMRDAQLCALLSIAQSLQAIARRMPADAS